jgi:MoxR-like ATPase
MTTREKFVAFMQNLSAAFPERREVITGTFHAVLTGQHVLLLGDPGTAKSLLCRNIGQGLGGSWFELLLSPFTKPEEIAGPVSLKGLDHDQYVRITKATMMDVHFAFIDECFKASSAILNSMLTAINERIFHNGSMGPQKIPLRTMFGASNELPQSKDLEALWDRFVLRFWIGYLTRRENMKSMVKAKVPNLQSGLTLADLDAAQAEVAAVTVSDATIEAMLDLREALKAEGVVVSDRRWRACLQLTQAAAWLDGEAETFPEHLGVLVDALWRTPQDRQKVARIVGQVADPVSAKAAETLTAACELAAKVAGTQCANRDEYRKLTGDALVNFDTYQDKLESLAKSARRQITKQTVADAAAEVKALREDVARVAATALRLRASA